ncbi:MAG: aminotransferase class I/II-fold pyridoxal phosphate-dependent enzyme [Clostridiales bacterium]|jgi:aminotransferase|nr:aminotransferase class I/II-fold pyridoxal phosphate-dependent enzyme [Clostridiales bacterium]
MFDAEKLLNARVKSIPPSGIRKFFDIVSELPDAISLGVGEPDFVTPWAIRDAAVKSIQKGYTQYTSNRGLPALREQIALYTEEGIGVSYDPVHEVLVTVGASEAIDLAVRAVTEPGDEVLIPEPSYVSYSPCVRLAGGVPVIVPTTFAEEFKLNPAAVKRAITTKTKAIILPYPNNPTGATMEKAALQKVADVLSKHSIFVLSDEIYGELTYGDATHASIASLKNMRERTILINGFSKAFAMTGWRLGYACAPRAVVDAMTKIHQYTIMCAPTAGQYAALYALKSGRADGFAAVKEMRESYDTRRKLMVKSFRDMGLDCFEPQGAFYVFPSVAALEMDGETFANKLLKEEEVAVVPGAAFGTYGASHVRCCYATGIKNLAEAMDRMRRFVRRNTR